MIKSIELINLPFNVHAVNKPQHTFFAAMDQADQLNREKSLLEAVERDEFSTQRQLSQAIGLSLGKTHYLLKELIGRGLIKVGNFQRSQSKLGYAYLLTPSGIEEKISITKKFLAAKEREYENLRYEIEKLKSELDSDDSESGVKS